MKNLSQKDKTMLLVMAAVVILGGMFWFYVKPAKKNLADQQTKVTDAQGQIDTLTAQVNALQAKSNPKAKGSEKTNVADELRLAKAYPPKNDLPATILQIEAIANASGVAFVEGTPDKGTNYAGTTGTAFAIKVTGRYFQVQNFIARMHSQVDVDGSGRLEINGRLFAVTKADVELDSSAAGSSTSSTGLVTSATPVSATITAIAFSHSPVAATPAAATTPGTGTTPASTTPTSTGGATS